MCALDPTRAKFLDQILASHLPSQVAKRYTFPDGEAAAVYTLSERTARPVLLYVASFAPTIEPGVHDFGIDYYEHPVASAEEAAQRLAEFTQEQAAQFRTSCRTR